MNVTNPLVSQRLAQLKESGIAPVAAIKAIHLEFGLSLGEAKREFSSSPAWEQEATNGDQLHQELVIACSNEPES